MRDHRGVERMIAIVAAHPVELALVVARLTARRREDGCVWGRLRGVPVALVLTGQGWQRADRAARRAFRIPGWELCLITGFAGATQAGLGVGALVIPERLLDVARGPSTVRPTHDVTSIRRALCATDGTMATVKRVVGDPEAKAQLGRRWQVAAVDLESAAVAAAAQDQEIPWMVARVVLDPVDRPLGVTSVGHAAALAISVVGWPRLRQFSLDLHTAQQHLGDSISRIVEHVASTPTARRQVVG